MGDGSKIWTESGSGQDRDLDRIGIWTESEDSDGISGRVGKNNPDGLKVGGVEGGWK